MKRSPLPWLNFSATLITLLINALGYFLPAANGQTGAEMLISSEGYFMPASYVFSFWGALGLGLLAFSFYQLLNPQRCARTLQRLGYLYVLSSLAESAWVLLWRSGHYGLAFIALLVLLASLIGIYLRLDINLHPISSAEKFHTHLVFSLYLSWITVITFTHTSFILSAKQWNGWGLPPESWAVILIIVTVALATIVTLTRHDLAYLAVQAWALSGIGLAQRQMPLIAGSAWAATAIISLLMVLAVLLRRAYTVERFVSER